MDHVVDVGPLVQPERVSEGIDQERHRDREIELARIRLGSTAKTPRKRGDEKRSAVAKRPDLHGLAAVPRCVRVAEGVDGHADDRRLGGRDGADPGEIDR